MDIETAYADMRQHLAELRNGQADGLPDDMLADVADALASDVEAIDGWLRQGGFLPKSWQS